MKPLPHLVFDRWAAENYERGGWTVTEVRTGVWEVINPREVARKLSEEAPGGRKPGKRPGLS